MKNGVWKASVDTKKWMKGAAIRAVKTMAQTAVSLGVCCIGVAPGRCLINVDVDHRTAGSGKRGGINHEKCESVTSGITEKS